jgi:hypothetical protein
MVNLLSKRLQKRKDELVLQLPTASEDAAQKNEQCNGQKSAAREATPSITAAVSVVSVRSEIRALKAIRIP